MVIFSNCIDNLMEVLMDDLSIFGSSFDMCRGNLSIMRKICEEVNLILKREKK